MAARPARSLTVQTLTARPAAWARATRSAVTSVTKGCTARKPASAASASAGPGSAVQPERAERHALVGGLDGAQRGRLERRDKHPLGPTRLLDRRYREGGDRLALVPTGVLGRVLDLDIDEHPLARSERVRQKRDVDRQVGHSELADGTEAGHLGVVVDGQTTVGGEANIELDAVRATAAGLGEGVQRVLGEAHRRPVGRFCATPVSPHRCHVAHESSALQVKKFTKTPCTA